MEYGNGNYLNQHLRTNNIVDRSHSIDAVVITMWNRTRYCIRYISNWANPFPLNSRTQAFSRGPANDLVPDDTKPFPGRMMINHQWGLMAFTYRAIAQETLKIHLRDMRSKITNSVLQLRLPLSECVNGYFGTCISSIGSFRDGLYLHGYLSYCLATPVISCILSCLVK